MRVAAEAKCFTIRGSAGPGIAFDRVVELLRVESLKLRAKPRELARGKLFDGFFYVFGSSHVRDIAFASDTEKGRPEA
jgi:hypothetical protein